MSAELPAPPPMPGPLAALLVPTITTERPRPSPAGSEALDSDRASGADSIEDARETLAQNPGDWMAHSSMCIAELARGDLRAAEAAILAALSIAPLEPRLLADYAAVLTAAGQFEKASSVLDQAEAIDPQSLMVLYNRCALAEERGDEALATTLRSRIVARMSDADALLHDSLEEDDWAAKRTRLAELGAIERERAELTAHDRRLHGTPVGRASVAIDRFGGRPVVYVVLAIAGVVAWAIGALGLGQVGDAIGGLVVLGAIIFVLMAASA